MRKEPQKVKSYKCECECGAEWVMVVFHSPAFVDINPLCPYCGGAITKDMEAA